MSLLESYLKKRGVSDQQLADAKTSNRSAAGVGGVTQNAGLSVPKSQAQPKLSVPSQRQTASASPMMSYINKRIKGWEEEAQAAQRRLTTANNEAAVKNRYLSSGQQGMPTMGMAMQQQKKGQGSVSGNAAIALDSNGSANKANSLYNEIQQFRHGEAMSSDDITNYLERADELKRDASYSIAWLTNNKSRMSQPEYDRLYKQYKEQSAIADEVRTLAEYYQNGGDAALYAETPAMRQQFVDGTLDIDQPAAEVERLTNEIIDLEEQKASYTNLINGPKPDDTTGYYERQKEYRGQLRGINELLAAKYEELGIAQQRQGLYLGFVDAHRESDPSAQAKTEEGKKLYDEATKNLQSQYEADYRVTGLKPQEHTFGSKEELDSWLSYEWAENNDKDKASLVTTYNPINGSYTVRYNNFSQGYLNEGAAMLDARNANPTALSLDHMNDKQKETYYYLLGSGYEDMAISYANECAREARLKESERVSKYIEEHPNWGIPGTIAYSLLFPFAGHDILYGSGYVDTGLSVNPNLGPGGYRDAIVSGNVSTLNKLSGTIGEKVPVLGGKGLGDLYSTALSGAESYGSAMAFGKFATLPLALSAASSAYNDAVARGISEDEAQLTGLAAGAAEAIFESLSIGRFLDGKVTSSVLKDILIQGGVEASEEVSTALANHAMDRWINRDKSQYEQDIAAYMQENNVGRDEAETAVTKKFLEDVTYEGLAAFATGTVMSAGPNIANHKNADRIIADKSNFNVSKGDRMLAEQAYVAAGVKHSDSEQQAHRKITQWIQDGAPITMEQRKQALSNYVESENASKNKSEVEKRADAVQHESPDSTVIRSEGTQVYLDLGLPLQMAEMAGAVLDGIVNGEITAETITNQQAAALWLDSQIGVDAVSRVLGIDVQRTQTGAPARKLAKAVVQQYEQNKAVATPVSQVQQAAKTIPETAEWQNVEAAQAQEMPQMAQPVQPVQQTQQPRAIPKKMGVSLAERMDASYSPQTAAKPVESVEPTKPAQQTVQDKRVIPRAVPRATQATAQNGQMQNEQQTVNIPRAIPRAETDRITVAQTVAERSAASEKASVSGNVAEGTMDYSSFKTEYAEFGKADKNTVLPLHDLYVDAVNAGNNVLTPAQYAEQYRKDNPKAKKKDIAASYRQYLESENARGETRQSTKTGTVGLERNEYSEKLDKAVTDAVDSLGKLFGLRIRFAKLGAKNNGYYTIGTNDVVLDIAPSRKGIAKENAFRFVIAHEIGHAAKDRLGAERWQQFEDYAVKIMGGEKAITAKQKEGADYADEAVAREDVACDFIGQLLSDKATLDNFCEAIRSGEVQKETARGFMAAVRKILGKLRGKGIKQFDAVTKQLAEKTAKQFGTELETAENAVKAMQQVLSEAARAEKSTTQEGVAKSDQEISSKVRFSHKNYANQVDDVKNNTHNSLSHVYMGTTPQGLVNILGLPKIPMLITPNHVYSLAVSEATAKAEKRYRKGTNYHDLGWNQVKQLPEDVNTPAAIIKSNTDKNDLRFVVITNKTDQRGDPIIAAFKPDGTGKFLNFDWDATIMVSAYGKIGLRNYLARAKTENRILYINKKRSQTDSQRPGLQLSNTMLSVDFSNSLSQFRTLVNKSFAGTSFANDSGSKKVLYSKKSGSETTDYSDVYQEASKDGEIREEISEAIGKNGLALVDGNGNVAVVAKPSKNGIDDVIVDPSRWDTRFSRKTWGEDILTDDEGNATSGKGLFINLMKDTGYSQEDIDRAVARMDALLEVLSEDFGAFRKLNDNLEKGITTNILNDRQRVLFALISNGDYPINGELSTTCVNRQAFQAVYERLLKSGVMKDVVFNSAAIARTNEILRDYGYLTACFSCFVESRRVQVQKWAESFVSKWNEIAEKHGAKERFGFFDSLGQTEKRKVGDVLDIEEQLRSVEKNDKGNVKLARGNILKKIDELMTKVPGLAKKLVVEDVMSVEALTAMRQYGSAGQNIVALLRSSYGAATPKISQNFEAYGGDFAKLSFDYIKDILGSGVTGANDLVKRIARERTDATFKGMKPMQKTWDTEYKRQLNSAETKRQALREYLFRVAGIRYQSFSDFDITQVFDKMQLFNDVAALRAPLHEYTKVTSDIRIFGMTGAKINASVIHQVDPSLGKENAGLVRLANGELGYVADDRRHYEESGKNNPHRAPQSVDYMDAVALMLDPRYAENVGTIAIGFSNKHIRMMLNDPNIRMVIPYHRSGLPQLYMHLTGLSAYNESSKKMELIVEDYTDYQTAGVKAVYDEGGKKVDLSKLKEADRDAIKEAATSWKFASHLVDNGYDAVKTANEYKEWCSTKQSYKASDGKTYSFTVTPIFEQFSDEENYYKVLIDFDTYNVVTGEIAPQTAVTLSYAGDAAATTLTEAQVEEYRKRLEDNGLFSSEQIDGYVEWAKQDLFDMIRTEMAKEQEYIERTDKNADAAFSDVKDMLLSEFRKGEYSEKAAMKQLGISVTEGKAASYNQKTVNYASEVRHSKKSGEDRLVSLSPVAKQRAEAAVTRKSTKEDMVKQFGKIEPGEEVKGKPFRDAEVPKRTAKGSRVSKTVRTAVEAEITPDEMIPKIDEAIVNDLFSYIPEANKDRYERVKTQFENYSVDEVRDIFNKEVATGKVSADNVAMGILLYNHYATESQKAGTAQERRAAAQKATRTLADLSAVVRSGAQATQMVRMLKRLSPEMKVYSLEHSVKRLQEHINERHGDKAPKLQIDEELAAKWVGALNSGDKAKANEYEDLLLESIARQMPKTFMDRWNAWRYTAMLGNFKTLLRNFFGNALFMPLQATKNATGAAIEAISQKVGLIDKSKRTKSFGAFATKKGRALLDYAKADFATDEVSDILEQVSVGKYRDGTLENKLDKAIQEYKSTFQVSQQNKLAKVVTSIPAGWQKATNYVMNEAPFVSDKAFQGKHYRMAFAQAAMARGYTAEMLQSGKVSDSKLNEIREYAARQAAKATYRDANMFSKQVSKMRFKGKNLGGKIGNVVLEGILPFRATPMNVLVRAVEYSPVGLFKALAIDSFSLASGKISATEYMDRLTSGLTGSALFALGAVLSSLGVIRLDTDEDDEREGRQNYSIEIGDVSITLDWLAPAAIPFFMGAEIQQAFGAEEWDWVDGLGRAFEPMLEMSMLSGISDILDTMAFASQDGIDIPTIVSAFFVQPFVSYVGQAVPTLLGQLASSLEPKRTSTYVGDIKGSIARNFVRSVARVTEKLPFVDWRQIDYVDTWGREDGDEHPAMRFFNNFINPAYVSVINQTDADSEIRRLEEATGSDISPTRRGYTITVSQYDEEGNKVSSEKVSLNGDQYEAYSRAYGEQAALMIAALMSSDYYDTLSDEDKVKAFNDIDSLADEYGKIAANVGYELPPSGTDRKLYDLVETGIPIAEAYAAKLLHKQLDENKEIRTYDKPEIFSAWVLNNSEWTEEQKAKIIENYGAFSSGYTVKPESYNEMIAAGISADAALAISTGLRDLEPEGDAESVTDLQRWTSIIGDANANKLSDAETDAALRIYMNEDALAKYDACSKAGVTARQYVAVAQKISNLKPLDGAEGITEAQKVAVCIKAVNSVKAQDALIRRYLGEKSEAKYDAIRKSGVTPTEYSSFISARNTYAGGSWSKGELRSWLNSQNFSDKEKAALWAAANSAWGRDDPDGWRK